MTSVVEFSKGRGEPDWLQSKRQKAEAQFVNLDLPYIERVKYDRWGLDRLEILESNPDSLGAEAIHFNQLPDHPTLIQVGSQTIFSQSQKDLQEQGVVFADFWSALKQIPQVIEKYFGSAIKAEEDKLTAGNQAFFTSGAVLYVPDQVEVTVPMEGIFQTADTNFVSHLLIIVGKNAKLNYLERLKSSKDQKIIANINIEVVAEAGSQIKFSAIDQLGPQVSAFISRRGLLYENASIDFSLGIMNEGNTVSDFDSDLKGDGSHSEIKAVGVSMGRQVQGVDTRVTNFGKNSVGHILQHGVILESGTLTFNGIGHIMKGAKGADAQQESRVLMLSDTARSDANPILLIDENDVTAGHAASIGQIDPEDMYYLMSRGLDEDTAKRLVIRGFLGTVISNIPLQSVRDEFIETIEKKLAL